MELAYSLHPEALDFDLYCDIFSAANAESKFSISNNIIILLVGNLMTREAH